MIDLELPPPGWSSANDIDAALKTLHLPAQALADWYRGWAEELDEAPGLVPAFAEAAREAAGQISAIADRVEEACATGIMRRADFPEARAQLPPIPAQHQDKDPRIFVLGKWLAERNPAGDGPRRTG